MTNNEKFMAVVDKTSAVAKKYAYPSALSWAKQAFVDGQIAIADYEAYEKICNIRNFMAMGNADDIQIPEKNLKVAEDFYTAICQWEAKKAAPQGSQMAKAAAPAKPLTYVKEGDYVLFYAGVHYGEGVNFRRRFDVFQVKRRGLGPLYDCRFNLKKDTKLYIGDWLPRGLGNAVFLVIPGGLPKGTLSEQHAHLWSSDDNGKIKVVNGKAEMYIACDTWDEKTGRKNFRKLTCDTRSVIPACFDSENPLAIEEVRDFLIKHYDGKYYIDVPWWTSDWKSHARERELTKG